jgi:thioredoxin 1
MSENTGSADDLDTIRERKRNRLRTGVDPASTADSSTDGIADGTDAAGGDDARTPTEPIVVDGVESFRTLLNDREVVLAEFSATWCGPCRTLEPILERVAARSPGAIATIDIDANPDIARRYAVRSVPTLLLFADGEPIERLLGMQDEAVLADLIEEHA